MCSAVRGQFLLADRLPRVEEATEAILNANCPDSFGPWWCTVLPFLATKLALLDVDAVGVEAADVDAADVKGLMSKVEDVLTRTPPPRRHLARRLVDCLARCLFFHRFLSLLFLWLCRRQAKPRGNSTSPLPVAPSMDAHGGGSRPTWRSRRRRWWQWQQNGGGGRKGGGFGWRSARRTDGPVLVRTFRCSARGATRERSRSASACRHAIARVCASKKCHVQRQ
jgi:hypothetical protein